MNKNFGENAIWDLHKTPEKRTVFLKRQKTKKKQQKEQTKWHTVCPSIKWTTWVSANFFFGASSPQSPVYSVPTTDGRVTFSPSSTSERNDNAKTGDCKQYESYLSEYARRFKSVHYPHVLIIYVSYILWYS